MDVEPNSEKTRMKRDLVFTIQVSTNLDLGWDYGRRVGLAVGQYGTLRGAEKDSIKEHLKKLLSSFVSIMEKSILRVLQILEFLPIQTGFAERCTQLGLQFQIGNEKRETTRCQNVMGILAM